MKGYELKIETLSPLHLGGGKADVIIDAEVVHEDYETSSTRHMFYGSSLYFTYTLIEGYELTAFRLFGEENDLATADNDMHAINIIAVISGASVTFMYIVDKERAFAILLSNMLKYLFILTVQ
jgi:hypothetical protein